ncbi:MAG: hypothetical protein ABJN05_14010 [Sulfitobacter dubius]
MTIASKCEEGPFKQTSFWLATNHIADVEERKDQFCLCRNAFPISDFQSA